MPAVFWGSKNRLTRLEGSLYVLSITANSMTYGRLQDEEDNDGFGSGLPDDRVREHEHTN